MNRRYRHGAISQINPLYSRSMRSIQQIYCTYLKIGRRLALARISAPPPLRLPSFLKW